MIPFATSLLTGDACPNGYCARAAYFDGSLDYLSRGADLTGSADTKLFTLSFWVRMDAVGASAQYLYSNDNSSYVRASSGTVSILMKQAGGTNALLASLGTAISANQWGHVLASVDLSDTLKRHVYVNGSADSTTWSVYNNVAMDFTATEHRIANIDDATPGVKLTGHLADFYMDLGVYTDLSVQANREKYIKSSAPVYLGSDGSIPTGTAPIMFFSGEIDSWHTNKGSGGGFTENGALTQEFDQIIAVGR